MLFFSSSRRCHVYAVNCWQSEHCQVNKYPNTIITGSNRTQIDAVYRLMSSGTEIAIVAASAFTDRAPLNILGAGVTDEHVCYLVALGNGKQWLSGVKLIDVVRRCERRALD